MRPESRADLDHGALPAIQATHQTHDPQAGDVGAVLSSQQNKTLDACNGVSVPVGEGHVSVGETHQDFSCLTFGRRDGASEAMLSHTCVPQETQQLWCVLDCRDLMQGEKMAGIVLHFRN